MPTLSTLHFVYCGMKLHELLPEARRNCGKYFQRLLYFIDSPIAKNNKACATLKNTLYKGFVLNNSDQEKSLGCLCRKEKLADEKTDYEAGYVMYRKTFFISFTNFKFSYCPHTCLETFIIFLKSYCYRCVSSVHLNPQSFLSSNYAAFALFSPKCQNMENSPQTLTFRFLKNFLMFFEVPRQYASNKVSPSL